MSCQAPQGRNWLSELRKQKPFSCDSMRNFESVPRAFLFLFPSTSHPKLLAPNYCYLSQGRVPYDSAPGYWGLQAQHSSTTLTCNSDQLPAEVAVPWLWSHGQTARLPIAVVCESGSRLLSCPLCPLITTACGGFSGPSNPHRTDGEEGPCLGHGILVAFLGPLIVIITAIC